MEGKTENGLPKHGMMSEPNATRIVVYLLSYLIVAVVGHFFVIGLLKRFPLKEKEGLEGAGAIIGVLERIFTITFVLMGEYTALALIFTAKSIARFEKLKEREFAEYYLIGTLSSILFAVLVGIFTLWLIKRL